MRHINYCNFNRITNKFGIVYENWLLEQLHCLGSINSMPELQVLQNTNAVITGSLPLLLMTLNHDEDDTVAINNLNILVSQDRTAEWYRYLLESAGFAW